MTKAVEVLGAVYENLPAILAMAAIIFGIAIRVKRFIRMTEEEKKKLLKEQSDKIVELVGEQLLSMVSKAESKWGSQTGKIKKSEVWENLLAQYGKLTEYIEKGLVDKQLVDEMIDEAVKQMQHIIETNTAAKTAIIGTAEAVMEVPAETSDENRKEE